MSRLLPEHSVPSSFVSINAMPLAASGKVDYDKLPRREASSLIVHEGAVVAGRTKTEQVLLDIWKQVLRLSSVGVYDNFFDLGGDSILGIRVVVKARQAGLVLHPSQLFQYATIAELAGVAELLPTGSVVDEPVSGPVPLTPIQYWFFEWNAEGSGPLLPDTVHRAD